MVSLEVLQRRIPYAVMPVLWLAIHLAVHFGNAGHWLRLLSMRFALVADDPVSFTDAMNAEVPHSFFEEVSGSTEPSASPMAQAQSWASRAVRSMPVVASSRAQYWQSLFAHFFAHHRDHRQSGEPPLAGAAPMAGTSHALRALRELARRLLPCFTSLFIHYNRMSLVNSIISYIYALSMTVKPAQFFSASRWEPLQDVLGALSGAFLTNLVFQCVSGSLTPSGLCKQSVLTLMKASPTLNALASAASAATIFLQSSLPFLASREAAAEVRIRDPDMVTAADLVSSEDLGATHPTHAAGAAAAAATTVNHVPHGYLSGGEGIAYAFSGFRLGRYHETEQLRGTVWQFVAGVPIQSSSSLSNDYSVINFLWHRGMRPDVEWSTTSANDVNTDTHHVSRVHNDNRHSGGQGMSSTTSRASSSSQDAGFDVFYSTSSSTELYVMINGGSFAMGLALGASCRAVPGLMLWARRHFAVVRAMEDYLWPPPPPALWLPRELEEAVPANQQYDTVELIRVEVPSDCFTQFPPLSLGEPLRPLTASLAATGLATVGGGGNDGEAVGDAASDKTDEPTVEDDLASSSHARQARNKESTAVHEGCVSLTLLVPSRCFCPITRSLMHDPVRTQDGFTYDREAITVWLNSHETSPMTNLPLSTRDLQPDLTIRGEISTAVHTFLQRVGPEYIRR